MASQPNTPAILDAIQGYMSALTWGSGQSFALAQIEEIKDITNLVANGGACLEIYGTDDDSQHKTFGGYVTDEQDWMLLALVSKDTALYARQIYAIRDAIVQPIMKHATIGNAGNVYHAQIRPKSGAYLDVRRDEQWLRGYRVKIMTRSEWVVPPPGVIS